MPINPGALAGRRIKFTGASVAGAGVLKSCGGTCGGGKLAAAADPAVEAVKLAKMGAFFRNGTLVSTIVKRQVDGTDPATTATAPQLAAAPAVNPGTSTASQVAAVVEKKRPKLSRRAKLGIGLAVLALVVFVASR